MLNIIKANILAILNHPFNLVRDNNNIKINTEVNLYNKLNSNNIGNPMGIRSYKKLNKKLLFFLKLLLLRICSTPSRVKLNTTKINKVKKIVILTTNEKYKVLK